MSDSWVKWSTWTEAGCTNFGEMCLKDVDKHLRKFGAEAKKLLDKTGADHILYGVKLYNNDGKLEEIKFCLLPMAVADATVSENRPQIHLFVNN